jgi:UDP-N-acetylglucosamine 2-epimerase
VVNIGLRQHGRERAPNILDTAPNAADILTKIAIAHSLTFRNGLRSLENPYGDGHAAERIVSRLVEVLSTTSRETLLRKRAQPLA